MLNDRILYFPNNATHPPQINVKKKIELTDEKLRKTADMYNQILLCNKNLAGVLLMCERHPPTSFTLIDMLEEKINVCKTTWSGAVFCIQH